ncbi:MAG: hypothetical protein ACLPY1_08145 [Terracidiphilus sp.]
MNFILRRFVAGAAVFVGLLVYASLREFPWAVDVAICVGFTVEVIGLVFTKRILATPPLKPMKPIQQMLLIHLGFLAGVIVIERIFPLLQMLLPGGPVQHGRQGSWALLVEISVITILGYVERAVLLSGPNAANSLPWANEAIFPATPASSGTGAMSAPLVNGVPVQAPASSGYTPTYSFASAPAVATPAATYIPVTPEASAPAAFTPVAFTPAASAPAASSAYMSSSGDDFEEFRLHLSQPKRPFRKPGITVKEEYELWLAHRAKVRAAASSTTQTA